MAKLLLVNGPNINLLGSREPEIYGKTNMAQINQHLESRAEKAGHMLECFQSNGEQAIIDRLQEAKQHAVDFIIINAAAYTHTSIAIADTLAAINIPYIEVHLSNVFAREEYRHHSYLSRGAVGIIAGFGAQSYDLALTVAIQSVQKK